MLSDKIKEWEQEMPVGIHKETGKKPLRRPSRRTLESRQSIRSRKWQQS